MRPAASRCCIGAKTQPTTRFCFSTSRRADTMPRVMKSASFRVARFAWLALACWVAHGETLKTQNVFLIISDGLRWQEVFTGAEELLISEANGGVRDTNGLRTNFWRATPETRRKQLMPFFWTDIASKGQLFGNQAKGSVVEVTNGKNFSYPGYN